MTDWTTLVQGPVQVCFFTLYVQKTCTNLVRFLVCNTWKSTQNMYVFPVSVRILPTWILRRNWYIGLARRHTYPRRNMRTHVSYPGVSDTSGSSLFARRAARSAQRARRFLAALQSTRPSLFLVGLVVLASVVVFARLLLLIHVAIPAYM